MRKEGFGVMEIVRNGLLFIAVFVLGVTSLSCKAERSSAKYTPMNGDVIFQKSLTRQSDLITRATGSEYTHVGVIYIHNGTTYVYEAVQPVRLTPLMKWISQGENGRYVVKRLTNRNAVITKACEARMQEVGMRFFGKSYDMTFLWSDKRMYCSELVWKIYKRGASIELCALKPLGSYLSNLTRPSDEQEITERYGDAVPYDEPVCAPDDLLYSPHLDVVAQSRK